MTRPVPRIGRFPLVAMLSLIAVIGTVTLSFASLVVGTYIPILLVGTGGVLVCGIPLVAGVYAVLRYTRFPRLRIGAFTVAQAMQVAAGATLLGWLGVAGVGVVGGAGAVLAGLWLTVLCIGRFVPALRWGEAAVTVPRADSGNIFPAVRPHDFVDESEGPAEASAWVLVPEDRPVVDDNGEVLFTVGPTAWAQAVGSTETALRIRDFSGREGTLTDVTGVIRN